MNEFNKKVVAIHAHPDDAEVFCAGTLALLKDAGYGITIVTMTAGGLGGINSTEVKTIKTREKEAKAATETLGANYYCLGGRDGYFFDTELMRLKLQSVIRKEKAGIIMSHLNFDYHTDHRTTAQVVEAVAMVSSLSNVPVPEEPLPITPLFYHTAVLGAADPIGNPIPKPHFHIDITSVMDRKMKMLELHVSQQELMRHMHKMDDFYDEMKKANEEFGKACGAPYAEAFWQHLGGGFQKDPLLQTVLGKYKK